MLGVELGLGVQALGFSLQLGGVNRGWDACHVFLPAQKSMLLSSTSWNDKTERKGKLRY